MKPRIGVLRGGPSTEYEVSLKTGSAMLKALNTDRYQAHDVLIDKHGAWFINGVPTHPSVIGRQIDVVCNALHGHYGEDGQVQRELERYGVPFTGSSAGPSALAMHKARTKEIFGRLGIRTPLSVEVDTSKQGAATAATRIFRTLPGPYIVKPVVGGSSVGTYRAGTHKELVGALTAVSDVTDHILVEQYIAGTEATCGVVEAFRGVEHYALPPVEIIPASGKYFFDYEAKYGGGTRELCPATFNRETKEQLQRLAVKIHQGLRLSHYSRSDFIITPRGIYALEVNTLPGLTEQSLLPKSLAAVGCTLSEFLDHLIQLARKKK